jgi:hypothetical protein
MKKHFLLVLLFSTALHASQQSCFYMFDLNFRAPKVTSWSFLSELRKSSGQKTAESVTQFLNAKKIEFKSSLSKEWPVFVEQWEKNFLNQESPSLIETLALEVAKSDLSDALIPDFKAALSNFLHSKGNIVERSRYRFLRSSFDVQEIEMASKAASIFYKKIIFRSSKNAFLSSQELLELTTELSLYLKLTMHPSPSPYFFIFNEFRKTLFSKEQFKALEDFSRIVAEKRIYLYTTIPKKLDPVLFKSFLKRGVPETISLRILALRAFFEGKSKDFLVSAYGLSLEEIDSITGGDFYGKLPRSMKNIWALSKNKDHLQNALFEKEIEMQVAALSTVVKMWSDVVLLVGPATLYYKTIELLSENEVKEVFSESEEEILSKNKQNEKNKKRYADIERAIQNRTETLLQLRSKLEEMNADFEKNKDLAQDPEFIESKEALKRTIISLENQIKRLNDQKKTIKIN